MTKQENILGELLLDDKKELFEQLLAIDNSIPKTIESVLIELQNFNPTIFSFWEREGMQPKLTTYLLHYVIPFNELLKQEKKENTKLLTAMLLSCFAWRTFDNCIDGHESNKTSHIVSLQSCLHLLEYSQRNFTTDAVKQMQSHYNIMSMQSIQEVESPIPLNEIWKRCSIFLFAPESLASLNDKNISIFKSYINYTGLAHDMTDLVSDITGGIISLPLSWLKENHCHNLLNIEGISQMNQKAKDAVKPLETFFKEVEIETKLPLMFHLLKESFQILQ